MKQKRVRKLMVLVSSLVLFLGIPMLWGTDSRADDTKLRSGDWIYQTDGTSATIVGYNGDEETIRIPAEIDGIPVRKIDSIKKLSNAEMSESEKYHEGAARVIIPDGVQYLGDYAFYQCGMEEVLIPGSVIEIGHSAFYNCQELKAVEIPEGTQKIDKWAFDSCYNLQHVSISSTVTDIGGDPFGADRIIFGFSADFTDLEFLAFGGFGTLTDITVSQDNAVYASYEGCLYSKDLTTLYICPKSRQEIAFPEGLKRIGDGAFSYCEHMGNLKLPATVTEIGKRSFYYCSAIKEIRLPEGLLSIGGQAFLECEGLTELHIPKHVQSIGIAAIGGTSISTLTVDADNPKFVVKDGALYDRSMTTLYAWTKVKDGTLAVVPEGVTEIMDGAFFGRNELSAVAIPRSVTSIPAAYETFDRLSDKTIIFYDPNHTTIRNTHVDNLTYMTYSGELNPFKDVRLNKYYSTAVLWAYHSKPQITAGTTAATFAPASTCTRAQVVTFLWRMAGEPEPKETVNPFTDVKEKDYFYKAVLWAAENNITAGTSATTFSPKETCVRSQFVSFLWRACGSPKPQSGNNPFSDVSSGKYYTDAVVWANENGIAYGKDESHFDPNGKIDRSQAVSFLFRARNVIAK